MKWQWEYDFLKSYSHCHFIMIPSLSPSWYEMGHFIPNGMNFSHVFSWWRKFEQRLLEPVFECDACYSRQGGICSPCPSVTFKEYAGDSTENNGACLITTGSKGCCKCNINTNTLNVAAVHSSLCVCVAGHSSAACLPCSIGSYKQTTSSEHC